MSRHSKAQNPGKTCCTIWNWKGGMKVHTAMKYHVGVPMAVQLTSAAKHDHYLFKEVHLPKVHEARRVKIFNWKKKPVALL